MKAYAQNEVFVGVGHRLWIPRCHLAYDIEKGIQVFADPPEYTRWGPVGVTGKCISWKFSGHVNYGQAQEYLKNLGFTLELEHKNQPEIYG